MRAMKIHPAAQTFGCLDVELRDIGRRHNAASIVLIALIYSLARYEQIVPLKLLPRIAA